MIKRAFYYHVSFSLHFTVVGWPLLAIITHYSLHIITHYAL